MKNCHDVLRAMSYKTNGTIQEADLYLSAFMDYLIETLSSGETIQLQSEMKFEVVNAAQKKGRNLHTKEEIIIPVHKKVKITTSEIFDKKVLKENG